MDGVWEGGACMRPEKGYASVCVCVLYVWVYMWRVETQVQLRLRSLNRSRGSRGVSVQRVSLSLG